MGYPFEEKLSNEVRIRTFSPNVDDAELIWHRDFFDRTVKVVEAHGWYLQLDDDLPQELQAGKTYAIPKNFWHRVIKKRECGKLVVEITEVKSP